MGTVPGRLAARQLSSSGTTAVGSSGLAPASPGAGSAGSSASPAAGTGSAPAELADRLGRFSWVLRVAGFSGVRGDYGLCWHGFG